MENKLPVVGKRYKLRNQLGSGNGDIVMVVSVDNDFSCKLYFEKSDSVSSDPLPLASFCNICEELPDSNSQKPEEVQVDLDKKKVSEVESALKTLKKHLATVEENDLAKQYVNKAFSFFFMRLYYVAQNIVNALEAEKNMSKPESKIDMKEERVEPMNKSLIYPESPPTLGESVHWNSKVTQDSDEPVSIWNDVGQRLDKANIPVETKKMFEVMAIYMAALQKDIEELKKK